MVIPLRDPTSYARGGGTIIKVCILHPSLPRSLIGARAGLQKRRGFRGKVLNTKLKGLLKGVFLEEKNGVSLSAISNFALGGGAMGVRKKKVGEGDALAMRSILTLLQGVKRKRGPHVPLRMPYVSEKEWEPPGGGGKRKGGEGEEKLRPRPTFRIQVLNVANDRSIEEKKNNDEGKEKGTAERERTCRRGKGSQRTWGEGETPFVETLYCVKYEHK